MKQQATGASVILSQANGTIAQTKRDGTTPHLSREFKQLRKGVPNNSKYLLGGNLNQTMQSNTVTSKTVEINSSNDNLYNSKLQTPNSKP